MKIALLCGHYPYSGAGVIARETALGLSSDHEVTFIHGGDSNEERHEDGMRIISLRLPEPSRRKVRHLYRNPEVSRALAEVLASVAPDVIHFHIIQRRSFSLASLLLSRRFPTVWTLHDQWPLCVKSVPRPPSCEGMKKFCAFCTTWPGLSLVNKLVKETVFAASPLQVVVPSRWLGSLLSHSFLGRKKVHLVYNGVDLQKFQPSEELVTEAQTREGRTLLFVAGPNNPTKGLEELLGVFTALKDRWPSLKLRVVGDLPPGASSRDGVEFVGRVDRESMASEYRRGDLFVLPTLADNTPVTLMEAMACGLPSVVSAVGGIPEVVEEGVTGRLVAAGDLAALSQAVESFLKDEEGRRKMGINARRLCESRFSSRRMVSEMETVYESTLGDAPGLRFSTARALSPGSRR